MLDALKGAAGTEGDGLIRVFDVFSYVSDKVPAEANQHPVFKAHDVENNFPLALYEGGKKAATARGYVKSARLKTLHGLTRIGLNQKLVDRWKIWLITSRSPCTSGPSSRRGRSREDPGLARTEVTTGIVA